MHTQEFAAMVLGTRPVEFPGMYNEEVCKGAWAHLFQEDLNFMWAHEKGLNQWWMDELTVDPQALQTDAEGIPLSGELRDAVVESNIVNASLGTVPTLQVVLCIHADKGALAFFPALGMKRGRVGSHEGATVWLDTLSEGDKLKLQQRAWYNKDVGVQKMKENGTAGQKLDFAEAFTKANFMVCQRAASSRPIGSIVMQACSTPLHHFIN